MKIGIIGLGCVGSALKKNFLEQAIEIVVYDKFKNGGVGSFEDTLGCKMIFLCLPTPYNSTLKEYNKSSINEVQKILYQSVEGYSPSKTENIIDFKANS